MKTILTGIAALSLLIGLVLGCSFIKSAGNDAKTSKGNPNTNANKSLSDTVIDTAVGEKTLGVPECDEVFKMLTDYANNPDDNFAVRAGKAMVVNKIKDSLRASIDENKADKVELAKACREAKTEFAKYRSDGNSNKAK